MKKAIFLHGFYASGSCPMAIALKEALKGEVEVLTPDLPLHPKEALAFVRELCRHERPDMLIGNSNGAFLAQMLATELQIPALLGNPHLKMSEFVTARIGENRYKSHRKDGQQEFFIEPILVEEFAELEAHQWDNWNHSMRNLCVGLFGEKDTLAHFEPEIREHYDGVFHFPGNHTPTLEEVSEWYIPRAMNLITKEGYMEKPIISIIIPVYNVEPYLSQCLDSLLYQTMKEIEIICVNDGSKDRSLDILREYASRDERIVVIDQENSGVSVARNNALKLVHGQYFMFLDSDDWIDRNTCEIAFNYVVQNDADCLMFSYTKEFEKHSSVNHIFSQDYFVWNKDNVEHNFHRRLFGPIEKELSAPHNADILVTPCMQLFKSEKFKSIIFEDIRQVGTFEDGLYQMNLYKDCEKFVYIDKPFYHYRKTNEGSITTRYKPDLYEKWQHLYDIIDGYISEWKLSEDYRKALSNRIALGILGLGLNQVHSSDTICQGGKKLNKMLSAERYEKALANLDTSSMPLVWKLFYYLAKHKMTFFLFSMLKVIEYGRTHKII